MVPPLVRCLVDDVVVALVGDVDPTRAGSISRHSSLQGRLLMCFGGPSFLVLESLSPASHFLCLDGADSPQVYSGRGLKGLSNSLEGVSRPWGSELAPAA